MRSRGPLRERSLLAIFDTLVLFPHAWGQIRFNWDRLRGRQSSIIEYKHGALEPLPQVVCGILGGEQQHVGAMTDGKVMQAVGAAADDISVRPIAGKSDRERPGVQIGSILQHNLQ